jgi:hypothetical protein
MAHIGAVRAALLLATISRSPLAVPSSSIANHRVVAKTILSERLLARIAVILSAVPAWKGGPERSRRIPLRNWQHQFTNSCGIQHKGILDRYVEV